MSLQAALAEHLAHCDQLYQMALEENRILRQEQRPPDEAWRERKRTAAARLEQSLARLREIPRDGERGGDVLEQARARSLQILLLDRENEQLLLRCSLGAPVRPPVPPSPSRPAVARAYAGKL